MAKKTKAATMKSGKKTAGTSKKAGQGKAPRGRTQAAKSARKSTERGSSRAAVTLYELSPALQLVEDYAAIQQLLNRYCRIVDHGSLDEIMELFHRDPVLIVHLEHDEYCEGREAVRGWYTRWIDNIRSRTRYMRHRISAPVVEISGNEASAACYLDGDSTSFSNKTVVIQGEYTDTLIKEDGRWLFKRRTISGFSTYTLETALKADPSAQRTSAVRGQ